MLELRTLPTNDPDQELLTPDPDPVAAYLTYLDEVHAGAVGDCGFTLADFRAHSKNCGSNQTSIHSLT